MASAGSISSQVRKLGTAGAHGEGGGSITGLTRKLQDQDLRTRDEAARVLWQRFVGYLTTAASRQLQEMHVNSSVEDQDDAVSSAFMKVYLSIVRGNLLLVDRQHLKNVLLKATREEVLNLASRAARNGAVRSDEAALAWVEGREMDPMINALVKEEWLKLFRALGNEEDLQQVALFKYLGYTDPEIARRLDLSVSTIERKSSIIRDEWIILVPGLIARSGGRGPSGPSVSISASEEISTVLSNIFGRS